MLEPELFSAVARSATPLRQSGWNSIPADLTDNFKNFYLVLNAASKRTTNFHKWCTRLRFFSLNLTYGALPAA